MEWGMPGPKPQYQPRFAPEELQHCLEILRQHRAPYALVQRAKLALLLAERPEISTGELSRQLKVGTTFVWIWRKRWALGPFTLEDRPRSGRPRGVRAKEVHATEVPSPVSSGAAPEGGSPVPGSSTSGGELPTSGS